MGYQREDLKLCENVSQRFHFFKAVRPDDNCTLKSEEGLVHDRNLVYPFSVDKKEFVIFELASNTKSTRSSIETQK